MTGQRLTLPLSAIRADDRAQPRAALLTDRIGEYMEDIGRGDVFPPLVVFRDLEAYWLADGFHRYHAFVGLEFESAECVVHEGGLRDAILYSCGANAAHGLRRTNADKRQAVSRMLKDEEWSHWSDREIARRCNVDNHLVARLREQLAPVLTREIPSEPASGSGPPNESDGAGRIQSQSRTYTDRHGNTSTMRTDNIGRKRGSGLPAETVTADAGGLFDSDPDNGRNGHSGVSAPAQADETAPVMTPQMVSDRENGWISSAMWEVERQFDRLMSMPPPAAVERFPTHHHHTFTAGKLTAMAEWFGDFATSWRQHIEGARNGETRS